MNETYVNNESSGQNIKYKKIILYYYVRCSVTTENSSVNFDHMYAAETPG